VGARFSVDPPAKYDLMLRSIYFNGPYCRFWKTGKYLFEFDDKNNGLKINSAAQSCFDINCLKLVLAPGSQFLLICFKQS